MSTLQLIKRFCRALALWTLGSAMAFAAFSSGSTGTDGALNFTTAGTVIFDPVALGLNPAGDNVFNFTTINIGAGVTVKLKASKLRERSVVWLATGAVTIAGTLDLSGATGYVGGSPASSRAPSEPGPGGYAGGVAGTDSSSAEPGAGPGGGQLAGYGNNACGSYATQGNCYNAGPVYGNSLLVPLRGGSGAAGLQGINSGGGGAGGGAIQIVSTLSITVTGSILTNGGLSDSCCAGLGSGGAIHLEAPAFAGAGTIQAIGGNGGGFGWIRIDTTTNSFTGTIQPTPTFGPLFNSPLPSAVPTVKLVTINGIAVPALPTGSYTMPDVTINSGTAVPISVAATNIPLGTILTLTISSETGTDQVVSSSALTGTVASSTATASILWPLGVSRIYVRATW